MEQCFVSRRECEIRHSSIEKMFGIIQSEIKELKNSIDRTNDNAEKVLANNEVKLALIESKINSLNKFKWQVSAYIIAAVFMVDLIIKYIFPTIHK